MSSRRCAHCGASLSETAVTCYQCLHPVSITESKIKGKTSKKQSRMPIIEEISLIFRHAPLVKKILSIFLVGWLLVVLFVLAPLSGQSSTSNGPSVVINGNGKISTTGNFEPGGSFSFNVDPNINSFNVYGGRAYSDLSKGGYHAVYAIQPQIQGLLAHNGVTWQQVEGVSNNGYPWGGAATQGEFPIRFETNTIKVPDDPKLRGQHVPIRLTIDLLYPRKVGDTNDNPQTTIDETLDVTIGTNEYSHVPNYGIYGLAVFLWAAGFIIVLISNKTYLTIIGVCEAIILPMLVV